MRTSLKWVAVIAVCLPMLAHAEEESIKSRIVSVGLFKNGLSVVKREALLPKAGTYLVEDVPDPIHGTWSVDSDATIETRVVERDVSRPAFGSDGINMQESLAGRTVTIHFRDGQIPPATGKVEAVPAKKEDDRTLLEERAALRTHAERPVQKFLVLKTDTGRIYVEPGMIAYLKADGNDDTVVKIHAPVLLLTALGDGDKPIKVTIKYLARGIGWAPGYRVDLADPKLLVLEQSAVIKNELGDLENTSVDLVSGYPSIQFGNLLSPMSPQMNWSSFFQQMTNPGNDFSNPMGQMALQSNAYAPRNAGGGAALGGPPPGEGVDIHYQSIGPRTLKRGEALNVMTAREKAEYERLVEWVVPDTRNEYGQPVNRNNGWSGREQASDDAPWDAVRFRNPFKFPMTTAPATVFSGDHFIGQRISTWVNSGEETCLQITKALSIRTSSSEHEEEGNRQEIWIGGRRYGKVAVTGEVKLTNFRKEETKVIVKRQFSGELVQAEGAPKKILREEGVYSVNQRNELNWNLTMKAGEEKTLTYKYTVLVLM